MLLSYYKRPLVIMLVILCGFIIAFKSRFVKPPDVPPFSMPRLGALVEGRIAEYPVKQNGKLRFAVDNVSIYHKPVKSSLMVYAADLKDMSYGDRVGFVADLHEPAGSYIPGGLDWASYLFRRGISAEARAMSPVESISPAPGYIRTASGFRKRVLDSFAKNLSADEAAVLSGVVIGEKRSVDEKLKDAFQRSGAMHLLVASGSNVGFVTVIVYALCAFIGLRRRYSGFLALLVSGFYVVAGGLDTPLVRAYIMFATGLVAFMCRRESGGFHSLVLAAFLLLAFSPRSLFDVGFQMSFLAAYGLIAGTSIWNDRIRHTCDVLFNIRRTKKGEFAAGLAYRIVSLFAVSFFAQLFLYPLMAVYFHQVSLVSLVSNIILVPAAGIAMTLGFLLALFPSFGVVTGIISLVTSVFMKIFIFLIKIFAAFPLAAVNVPEPSALVIAGFYVLAWTLLHWPLLGFTRYLFPALGFFLVLANSLLGSIGRLNVKEHVLLFGNRNVSSALIVDKKGIFLVNPGMNGKKLSDAVYAEGRYSLNAVLFTSLDENNFRGLADLSQKVRIKNIYLPFGPMNDYMYDSLSPARHSGANIQQIWPVSSGTVHLAWPEQVYGYAGRGEPYDWKVNDVRITNNGKCASIMKNGRWSTPDCHEGNEQLITDILFE